jgi:diguanylate cyclase (GGDEF)-like protein
MKKLLDMFWRGKIKNSLLTCYLVLALVLITLISTVLFYFLSDVTDEAKIIARFITIAALLVVIVYLPVVILVARKISSPLEVLAQGADEISRGNFGFTLDLNANHEIDTLALSFNRMSVKMKDQREVLLKQISLLEAQKQEIATQNEELAEANARLELIAITDQLTGAYNRRYIMREIEQELSRSVRHSLPMSITMIDIDNFKDINDTHGHQVGDEVLKEVVQVLSSSIRTSDLLGRYGGEEFIIIAPLTGHQEALILAERLRETVSKWPFETTYGFIKLTISLGVATYDGKTEASQGAILEQLLAQADEELYKAKAAGRNCVSPLYIEERAATS